MGGASASAARGPRNTATRSSKLSGALAWACFVFLLHCCAAVVGVHANVAAGADARGGGDRGLARIGGCTRGSTLSGATQRPQGGDALGSAGGSGPPGGSGRGDPVYPGGHGTLDDCWHLGCQQLDTGWGCIRCIGVFVPAIAVDSGPSPGGARGASGHQALRVRRRAADGPAGPCGIFAADVGGRGQASSCGAGGACTPRRFKRSGTAAASRGHEQQPKVAWPTDAGANSPRHIRPSVAAYCMPQGASNLRGPRLPLLRAPPHLHRLGHRDITSNSKYSPRKTVLTHQCRRMFWHWVRHVVQHGGIEAQRRSEMEDRVGKGTVLTHQCHRYIW